MRTLIIAEAGVNHNGDVATARALVDAAAAAGADFVKFQTFNADRLASARAPKAPYQRGASGTPGSQREMLRQFELSKAMHEDLIEHCRMRGVEFFSTAFDRESIDLLVDLGVNVFKIPSGELTDLPYLRHVGGHGRRVLLSTGMATLGEIEAAIDALEHAGTRRGLITLLHCTTEYPTPMADVNLLAMLAMRDAFRVAVGYSDHTLGITIPVAAVAIGASVIEKHFTLDRSLPGPDQKASLEPGELAEMVAAIRDVEIALGDGIKRLAPGEAENRLVARKSIVAAVPIRRGDPLGPHNLTVKRPGTGISPMRWDEVIGRTATRDFDADEALEL